QEVQAQELDQAKLVLMMFAGAVRFLDKAIELHFRDRMESGKYISKTKNIILELIASLDVENSGEMGTILLRAYRGLFTKLNEAHFRDDMEKAAEVRASLAELEESWKQVFASPEYHRFKQDRDQFRSSLMER
ncbi:MAG: flagellar export chaperone FliS, partial [Candidatus Latescibacterota bacterium]